MLDTRAVRLAARRLSVTLGGASIVRDVDIELRAGEVVALVGANGAGKSTLLRALSRSIALERGEIDVDGAPLPDDDAAAIARAIATVPQELPLAAGFSVREVVAMGRAPHQGAWMRPSAGDDELVDAVMRRAGLATLGDRAFDALSGGERRRVMVAQALAQDAGVLLLDEPAAFLDLGGACNLLELLHDEARRGRAILLSIHDLSLAARFADRVLLLAEGRIVASGSPDDVLDPTHLSATLGVAVRRLVDPSDGAFAFLPASRQELER